MIKVLLDKDTKIVKGMGYVIDWEDLINEDEEIIYVHPDLVKDLEIVDTMYVWNSETEEFDIL